MVKTTIWRLFFMAAACLIVIVAGGGTSFLGKPLGIAYLVLSASWWLLALVRERGVSSAYDRKQILIVTIAGGIAVPALVIMPPWEYAHFSGPIPRDWPLSWAGVALFATGIRVQARSMQTLRDLYTMRLGIQPVHRVVDRGPYRLVRHPGYLSYILSIAGIGLAMSSITGLAIACMIVPFLVWRIRNEEAMLLAELGDEYATYMKQTRWRLVPFVY